MPELPEVHTIAADLNEFVAGKTIMEAAVAYPKIVAGDSVRFVDLLRGAKINQVERFGKWIRFRLKGPSGVEALLVHLKMTGQFHLGQWPKKPGDWDKHDHAAFRLAEPGGGQEALFYRDMRKFGRLRAFDGPELQIFLAELKQGPDPFQVSEEEFFRRLTSRKSRLKCVLLDQTVVAGFGNIYVDESLLASGFSPLKAANTLSRKETDRLLKEARRIMAAAIEARGSTTSNYASLKGGGSYQKAHLAYGQTGQPCPFCGRPIERTIVGGRSTHFCPHCQKDH